MKKWTHLLLAAALSLGAAQAQARTPVPIVNHENVAVARSDGRPFTAAQVKKAILAAGEAGARKWQVTETSPGNLRATYNVRTHTVVTEIRYTASNFSVVYGDSTNMKYSSADSGPGVIHPFYNQWVQEFVQSIRGELNKI